jgi:predicted O-methyltransferase YrrM
VNVNTGSALDAVRAYVDATAVVDDPLAEARTAADEYGLLTPDAMTGELLTFLAARAAASSAAGTSGTAAGEQPTAVVMSPAAGVTGLYLFAGFGESGGRNRGHVTCIDPEAAHQHLARQAFAAADIRPSAFRFLPSSPLEGVTRLAVDSYDIVVSDCPVELVAATVDAALPALRPGGVLILLDSLLDGTAADPARTDRETTAVRDTQQQLRDRTDLAVARLPLGAGATLVTKLAA